MSVSLPAGEGQPVPDAGPSGETRPPDALGRGRRLLITGGARSGKSRHAEESAGRHEGAVTFVATAPDYAEDPDWQQRVAEHRARRPATWRTVETGDIAGTLLRAGPTECVLVDCLTLWLTAILDEAGWDDQDRALAAAEGAVNELLAALLTTTANVILVTNEVGSGIVPDQPSGRLFRDLLGRLNLSVAGICDDAVLVSVGIPLVLKGAAWPTST